MALRKEGPHYFFQGIEFWAQDGFVNMVDTKLADANNSDDDNASHQLRPGEFLKRAIAAYMSVPEGHPSDMFDARKMLEDAQTVTKLAKEQGDTADPLVQQYLSKHEKKVQLLMPGDMPLGSMPGSQYKFIRGDKPRNIFSGKESINIVPDLSLPVGSAFPAAQLRR